MSLLKRIEKARQGDSKDEFKADPDREQPKEPEWRRRAKAGELDAKVTHFDPDAPRRGYDG